MLLFNFIFLMHGTFLSWIWLMYTLFRLKEGKQLSTVLSHPAFQVDPLAAIHHHLQSTQPVSDEKPKKKSSKAERKKKKKDKLKTSSGPQSMDFWLDARTFILSSFMSQAYSYFGCQKIIPIKFCIWLTFYVDLSNMVHYRETFFYYPPWLEIKDANFPHRNGEILPVVFLWKELGVFIWSIQTQLWRMCSSRLDIKDVIRLKHSLLLKKKKKD